MKLKDVIWTVVVSGVVMWLLAGLIHEVVLEQFFRDNTQVEHKGTAIIFVAYLILAGFMTYLYDRLPKGRKPLIAGLQVGALVGVLWVFPHGLAMAAAHGKSISYQVLNGGWHLIEQGLGGFLIAWMYSRKKHVSP